MKLFNLKIFSVLLLAAIIAISCKKDPTPVATPLTPKYTLTQGTNVADTFAYNFFNKYQSYILFQFDPKDYWYGLYSSAGTSKDSIDYFNYVTDTAQKAVALGFLNAQWLSFYPAAYKQQYLMQYILVVDSLFDYTSTTRTGTPGKTEVFKTNGIDNMVLCGFGPSFAAKTAAQKTALRNELHFAFLYQWIYMRNKAVFPQAFYDVSSAKYGGTTRDSTPTTYNDYFVQGLLPPYSTAAPNNLFPGTVSLSTGALVNYTVPVAQYQTQDQDVAQYIRFIVQNNDAFINTYVNSTNPLYKKIQLKYNILLNYFTAQGINIRNINTTNINNLGPLNVY